MSQKEIQRDQLTRGLVGSEHVGLYQTSANFKVAIDTLVLLLPQMVAGIAAAAQDRDTEMQARIQEMARSPFPHYFKP